MFSGVGKSGSPGPKSTTSMPCSRSLMAASITAMVFDTEMREIRAASFIAYFSFLNRLLQSFFHDLGNQTRHRSTQFRDLFHEARTEIRIIFRRHHEHGFDVGRQAAIHQSHLEFVFVVGDGANSTNDDLRLLLSRVVHQQAVKHIDFDVPESRLQDLAHDLDALFHGEQRRLLRIGENRNDDVIEQPGAALDDIDVPERQRIERTGINCVVTILRL